MNLGPRFSISILGISLVLAFGLAPAAEGDSVIYTYSDTGPEGGFSWSFESPTFITWNDINGTTISSFLSTFIDPNDQIGQLGCTTIYQVVVSAPESTNPGVFTFFSGPGCNEITGNGFSSPITSFGTFTNGGFQTLSISPSGVPEPSSLLLLAGGSISLFSLWKWRRLTRRTSRTWGSFGTWSSL